MTNKEYRKTPGISRSDLWLMNKSPLHFKYHIDHPEDDKPTPALIFGTAMHKMALEPDEFDKEYAVLPTGIDRRTKSGKEAFANFADKAYGKTVITEDLYKEILRMTEALKQNKDAWQMLVGVHEESVFWVYQDTSLQCKIRPDVITVYDGKPYLVDYKTTDSCADGHFESACRKYGYKLQAGMYVEGMFQKEFREYGFAFVAQEKTPPYASRVYICSDDFINEGHDQFRTFLGTLKYCQLTGDWYGYEGPGHEPSILGGENND